MVPIATAYSEDSDMKISSVSKTFMSIIKEYVNGTVEVIFYSDNTARVITSRYINKCVHYNEYSVTYDISKDIHKIFLSANSTMTYIDRYIISQILLCLNVDADDIVVTMNRM